MAKACQQTVTVATPHLDPFKLFSISFSKKCSLIVHVATIVKFNVDTVTYANWLMIITKHLSPLLNCMTVTLYVGNFT